LRTTARRINDVRNIIREVTGKFKAKCDYIEVRIEETAETSIHFSGKELETLGTKAEYGGCVRCLVKGSWGFCSFNDVDQMEEFVEMAVAQAKLLGQGKTVLADVAPVEDEATLSLKKDPRGVSLDKKVALMKGYNDLINGYSKEITSSIVLYFDRYHTIWFGNSEGTNIVQEKMDVAGMCSAICAEGEKTRSQRIAFGSNDDYSCAEGLEKKVKEVCQLTIGQLRAPKVKSGRYTVIADPALTGVFIHEAFGHLSEADNVYENKKLQELMTLGAEYGSEKLNVYDTGLRRGVRGYLKYDDEGVPTEKTYLIREGRLVGRLHSRETAGAMGEAPTGNARAMSYRFPPICRMRNTCIEQGHASFEEMIKDIDLGVYAIDTTGGETQHEMFTFGAGRGYMIRNGKIAEMVRDVTLSGNVFATLKNIDAIGNDQAPFDGPGGCGKDGQWPLPVSHEGPHIRMRDVIIGGE
jgi:TldD protein